MKLLVGILIGIGITLWSTFPQSMYVRAEYAASPVRVHYSKAASSTPSAIESIPGYTDGATGLCLEDKDAIRKLGSDVWQPRALSLFGDEPMIITSLHEKSSPSIDDTFCVVMPIEFAPPLKVRVVNGKLVAAQ